jgi:hypothetical protein
MNQSAAPYSARPEPEAWHKPAVLIGGVGFLVASIAGDLAIGSFPRPGTASAKLASFYAVHHGQVLVGGWLQAVAAVLLALFGTALWVRVRERSASLLPAGLVLVCTVLAATTALAQAAVYGLLGDIGGMSGVSAGTLQAWHVLGSDGSLADTIAGSAFLLAVAAAGLAQAIPRSLAWSALVLAVLGLVPGPVGFFLSLVTLLWYPVAGIVLVRSRRAPGPETVRQRGASAPAAAA